LVISFCNFGQKKTVQGKKSISKKAKKLSKNPSKNLGKTFKI